MAGKYFSVAHFLRRTIMSNILHVHDDHLLSKHQDNIMTSLVQRLQRARGANDFRLVQLLEQEKRQIEEAVPQFEARSHWLIAIQNWLTQIL